MLSDLELESPETRADWRSISEEFYVESGYPGKFNPEHFFNFWTQSIRMGIGTWIAALDELDNPVGAFGCLFVNDPYTGDAAAVEQFWFVTKSARGSGKIGVSLFNAFEEECDRRGVKTRWMGHINEKNGAVLGRYYRRRGYAPADQLFRKDV